jgi:hypothetical protein
MREILELPKGNVLPSSEAHKGEDYPGKQIADQKSTRFRESLVQYADLVAVKMHSSGMSWEANCRALRSMGIQAPAGDAKDVQSIPGLSKMPADTQLQPGDVVITGSTATQRSGNSFIVTEDMKAAADSFHKIPDLTKYKDVRVFRFGEK